MARGCDCSFFIGCLCISLPFLLFGLIVALLVLFAYPSSPMFSIDLFNDQALNMTRVDDSPKNMTIHFDLVLKNENSAIGLHYPDPLNLTFSYFPNVSTVVLLAEYKLDSFYQGNGKTRYVRGVVETNGYPMVLEGTDIVFFRVDLVATFRYKKAGTKRHKVDLGCLVGVYHTTGEKMQRGFNIMVEPGLDSKLKKKEPPPSYD